MGGLEITRVDWDAAGAHAAAEQVGRDALERAGERLLDSAGRRVPYRTGALAGSGQIAGETDGFGEEIDVVVAGVVDRNLGSRRPAQ